MAYTALAYSDWASFQDAKSMATDNTDCSCYIKAWNLFNQSYWVYVTPHLITINSFRGEHKHTHTHTHTLTYMHTDICTGTNLRNKVPASLCAPGLHFWPFE